MYTLEGPFVGSFKFWPFTEEQKAREFLVLRYLGKAEAVAS